MTLEEPQNKPKYARVLGSAVWRETGCGNIVLDLPDCYISYNPAVRPSIFDAFFGGRAGREETAITSKGEFYILNGDHRKEIQEAYSKGGLQSAVMYYMQNKKKYGSEWSNGEFIDA